MKTQNTHTLVGQKVGYVRVSALDQNPARQLEMMSAAGVVKLFEEKESGKSMTKRTQLAAMLAYVRAGDVVVIESFSRLARNTRDLLEIVEQLKVLEVGFISLKEAIDTTTPAGQLMLTIFAAIAQFERETTLQRQREGIAIAKKEGKYKGRKAIAVSANFEKVHKEWRAGNITAVEAQKELGLTARTFYRQVAKYENK